MTTMMLFRKLTPAEIAEFRKAAREEYQVGSEVKSLWHPAYRWECELMNLEAVQAK